MQLREMTVRYRALAAVPPVERPQITTADSAVAVLRPILADECGEVFGALLLNTKHRVLCWCEVSRGGLAAAVVRPSDLFLRAVLGNAAAVILAHNHPSGDPTPSPDDRAMTARLRAAGVILGIDVLDHIVIGEGGRFVSFKAEGWL